MKTPLYLSTILMFLMLSCAHDSESDVIEPIIDNSNKTVTYSNTIASIMQSSCTTSGFHDAISKTARVDLTSFEHVKNSFENRDALEKLKEEKLKEEKCP